MIIRYATLEDIPTFVEIGRYFHARTRFKDYAFNETRLIAQFKAIIEMGHKNGTHCFFVAEDSEGQGIGGLIGCVERHFFSDQVVASIVHYDVLPEKRMSGAALRLLKAFRTWAENRGAVELSAGVNSGDEYEKMDKFFKRLGFMPVGGNYALKL